MSFFRNFYSSLSDLTWLRGQRNSAKAAWHYVLLFLLLISTLQLAPSAYRMPELLRQVISVVKTELPDFKAYAREGGLEVRDLTQPYVKTFRDGQEKFTLIVATTQTTTPDIGDYIDTKIENGLLIGRTEFVIHNGREGETKTQSLAGLPAREEPFTKDDVVQAVESFQDRWVYIFSLVVAIFYFLAMTVGKLVFLAFISLIVFIITAMAKRKWSFGEIYTLGLFALTLPTLAQTIARWSSINLPYVYTLILMVIMLGVIFQKEDAKTEAI